jgi:hypothetical protein
VAQTDGAPQGVEFQAAMQATEGRSGNDLRWVSLPDQMISAVAPSVVRTLVAQGGSKIRHLAWCRSPW